MLGRMRLKIYSIIELVRPSLHGMIACLPVCLGKFEMGGYSRNRPRSCTIGTGINSLNHETQAMKNIHTHTQPRSRQADRSTDKTEQSSDTAPAKAFECHPCLPAPLTALVYHIPLPYSACEMGVIVRG